MKFMKLEMFMKRLWNFSILPWSFFVLLMLSNLTWSCSSTDANRRSKRSQPNLPEEFVTNPQDPNSSPADTPQSPNGSSDLDADNRAIINFSSLNLSDLAGWSKVVVSVTSSKDNRTVLERLFTANDLNSSMGTTAEIAFGLYKISIIYYDASGIFLAEICAPEKDDPLSIMKKEYQFELRICRKGATTEPSSSVTIRPELVSP